MKHLTFSNGGTITVRCTSTLEDQTDLDENFIIKGTSGINGHAEISLFYWLVKRLNYTLNELIFFAINNELCLYINDEDDTFLVRYGACIGGVGDFNFDFNNDFFR